MRSDQIILGVGKSRHLLSMTAVFMRVAGCLNLYWLPRMPGKGPPAGLPLCCRVGWAPLSAVPLVLGQGTCWVVDLLPHIEFILTAVFRHLLKIELFGVQNQ